MEIWGNNSLHDSSPLSLFRLFLAQFQDFLVLVLLVATLLSGILGEYIDGLTIMAIVLLNALLGTFQEYRAENSLRMLQKLASPQALVLREGKLCQIDSSEVVPGDIIHFEQGDRICADMRLLESYSLIVNEAPLTGESLPVGKTQLPLEEAFSNPGDISNMVFSGTLVEEGKGRGVVVATGMQTQLGQIAHLMEQTEAKLTPLQVRLNSLGRILVGACLLVCFLVILLGLWRGETIYAMLMAGISLAVAAIPEGLPAIVTVSLALGVQRMVRRKAIIRRLPAVETLGSATVICSDKTGTMTQNRMVLKEIFADRNSFIMEAEGPTLKENNESFSFSNYEREKKAFAASMLALRIGAACNNATEEKNNSFSGFRGTPTEVALLKAAQASGLPLKYQIIFEHPFSAERKRMTVLSRDEGLKVYVKGAPETVLRRCRYIWKDGKPCPLTSEEKLIIQNKVEEMGSNALRTLAVAYRNFLPGEQMENEEEVEQNLIWVGLLGLEDPPRPEVIPAVASCRQAGIKVVMITGDHRNTAVAVGSRLGILNGGRVLTGEELDGLSDHELRAQVEEISIFSRVNPAHKLRVVRALKEKGHVVAMTGDGVNDAPAVKEADIGVAMGIAGTDVTKEAAALVLEDDNFASIVAAIEEGRNIYANVRKFIRFLLCCNTGEILTMLLTILIGLPLPLRPIQILWINLITDGLPALALSMEPPDKMVMLKPPRDKDSGIFSQSLWLRILSRGTLIAISTIIVFGVTLFQYNNLIYAQSAALTTLVVTQLLFVFECRTEVVPHWKAGLPSNHYLNFAVLISVLLLLPILYLPTFQKIFSTLPLGLDTWSIIGIVSFVPYLVIGLSGMLKKSIYK